MLKKAMSEGTVRELERRMDQVEQDVDALWRHVFHGPNDRRAPADMSESDAGGSASALAARVKALESALDKCYYAALYAENGFEPSEQALRTIQREVRRVKVPGEEE